VDYDFFRTAVPNAKADLGLGDGPLLLQVGALLQRKNQILSIQALKILKQRLGSVKLVLVGDGPWKAILQDEAKHLDLEDDVVFLGSISEDKLRAVYYACDVNLFPVKDQTWGLVPFEALVVGKPSIVAEGAGAAVVIGREKIGFLIKPNAEELAGSVLFALEHPELVKTMVEKGRRYVGENLTWEKYSLSMFVVFKSVLCPGGLKQTT
jgi:glycosyltransferase involved in cell wall biosynthesis